jgi:hypothetical protein
MRNDIRPSFEAREVRAPQDDAEPCFQIPGSALTGCPGMTKQVENITIARY